MPQVQDIFASLSGSRFSSKFDFCKGYYQVKMKDEDKDLTTCVTHAGSFLFHRDAVRFGERTGHIQPDYEKTSRGT